MIDFGRVRNLWRPTATTDATSAVTSLAYSTLPSATESTLNFNGSVSTADSRTTLDGLGRTHVSQTRQTQGGANYDSVETDYDSLGRVSRVTVPYSGTAGQTNSSAGATTTSYDALSRPLVVTDGGGGTVTYSYTQNDELMSIGPAPTGENPKRRQFEYDGLGRLVSVCEVTSAAGSGSCGQTVAQTGYLTKYAYDVNNNLLTVTQNAQPGGSAQTRTYAFDGLSRLVSETNPETNNSAVSYVYDSDATCRTSAGDLVKKTDAVGNVTCFGYDALHRNTTITYPSGSYAAATPSKTFVYDAATVNGVAMANAKGRLAEAYTGASGSKTTDLGFSYTKRGETSDVYQSSPHSGGYYHVAGTYWANGLVNTLNSGVSGLPTWATTPDGEGRVNGLSASSGTSPISNTFYGLWGGPTQVVFGAPSGAPQQNDLFTYDAMERVTSYSTTNAAVGTVLASPTWNANGTLGKLTTTVNRTNTACTYAHDDLSRLAAVNCGSGNWNQAFSYDAFGNGSKSGSGLGLSFQPVYSSSTNRYTALPAGSPAYDASGNVKADGFHSYAWDADGNLTTLDANPAMVYDAFDRRVEQTVSGDDDGNLVWRERW